MQLPDPAPAAQPAACPACGDPLDPDDRFCGHCGRATAPRATADAGPGTAAGADGAAPSHPHPPGHAPASPVPASPPPPPPPAEHAPAAPGAGLPHPGGPAAAPVPGAVPAPPVPPMTAGESRPSEHGPAQAGPAGPGGGIPRLNGPAETTGGNPAAATGPVPAPPGQPPNHAGGDRADEHGPSGRGGEEAAGHPAAETGSFRLAPPRQPGVPDAAAAAPAAEHSPDESPGGPAGMQNAAAAAPGSGSEPAAGTGPAATSEPAAGTGPGSGREPATGPGAASGPEPGNGGGRVCVACGLGGVDRDGYCEHCGHAQPRRRDHQEQELEGVAAVSDRGLRHHRNEDAFTVSAASLPDGSPAVAAVVCDGVSTAYRPDDASAAACAAGGEALLTALERGTGAQEAMRGALLAAFDAVTALAQEEVPDGVAHRNAPACTCVSAVVTGEVFTVGWIGDSRAYWIPDDRSRPPSRLTEDDSWAARMVAAGLMSQAEAYADERAHAITGWLGADAVEVDPHVAAFQPDGPGVIVVCTDGLWNYVESAAEMAAAVPADARARPLHSARTLLGVALDGGGHDNVTVAVLPFPAAAARAGSPSAPVAHRP